MVKRTINLRARNDELAVVSELTGVPLSFLKILNSYDMLNGRGVRKAMCYSDYKKLMKTQRYSSGQVISAVAARYSMNSDTVKQIVYNYNKTVHFCEKCGKQISGREYNNGNGLCNECFAKTIEYE